MKFLGIYLTEMYTAVYWKLQNIAEIIKELNNWINIP